MKEGGSTAPLMVGATDGPGHQRCNWIRRVMAQSTSHSAVRQQGNQKNNWAIYKGAASPPPCGGFAATLVFCYSFFCVESTSVGYVATAYCVYLSLVLILVVKVLGGGSTSSKLW
jgi:hypothetical protein